jgi:O-antigen/teichoic acid export membrane protein
MFGIVTNALVMRMLPTDQERDAYVLALSIVSLGAVVRALGLPKAVVRLIAENMGVYRP